MTDFMAYTVTRPPPSGGPEAGATPTDPTTAVERLPRQALPPGEVLVRVEWSAVNYKDAMVTQPGNRVARRSPLVPGVDLAGRVEQSADSAFAPGQAVLAHGYDLGVAHHGGFAQLARVPAGWLVPLPEGLSTRQSMIIGTAGFTAALSLRRLESVGLRAGAGPVLVTGATGGVGSLAVALLAGRGYEVVASTGRTGSEEYLRTLGAHDVVGRNDLVADDGRVLGPERWAGAVDCVGGRTLAQILRTLRYGAAVAASGLTGGSQLATTVYPMVVRGVALLGIDTVSTPIDLRRQVWSELAGAFAPELLDHVASTEIGLHQLDRALADVLAARTRGRLLVRPDLTPVA